MTTLAGCAWSATTSAPWITIGGTGTGSGSGTFGYTVAANSVATPRNGTIAVGGQVVTISQNAAPCSYTLSPASISVGSGTATGTFSMAATAGCSWTATSSAPWLTVTSGATGNGNGTVGYSVAANPNTTVRTATISAGGQTFTVTQAAVVCNTTISPTASSPTAAGGAATVAVTANAGSCAWTAASNAPWISITAGASGNGNGTVDYTVAANTSTTGRTGTMTIAGQTMTVTQAGAPCNYAISPTVASLGPEVGINTVAVTASAGCAWTASESASWISITGGASGSGNGTVTYSVTANPTTTARSAVMTIAGQNFDVTQAGQACTYTLTPAGASVPDAATTGSVAVGALGGCAWTATSPDPWVTITSGATGSGNGTVGYSVAVNTATSPRTATLTIGGQPFTITQAAAPCTYTATPASHSIPASGGPGTVTLSTQAGCAWNATTSAPWITISGTAAGTGSGTVDFAVAENPDGFGRSGTIAIGAQIVTVSQAAATCTYVFSPASVSVGCGRLDGQLLGRGKQRVCVDRVEQRAVVDDHERSEREREWHHFVQRRRQSDHCAALGNDQRRDRNVHRDAVVGRLHLFAVIDESFGGVSGVDREHFGDVSRRVLVDRRERRLVDHGHKRRNWCWQRHRDVVDCREHRSHVAQRHADDCGSDGHRDAARCCVHDDDFADERFRPRHPDERHRQCHVASGLCVDRGQQCRVDHDRFGRDRHWPRCRDLYHRRQHRDRGPDGFDDHRRTDL